jgi:hypothetical protein
VIDDTQPPQEMRIGVGKTSRICSQKLGGTMGKLNHQPFERRDRAYLGGKKCAFL